MSCLPQLMLIQRLSPRLTKLRAPECPSHYLIIRLAGMLGLVVRHAQLVDTDTESEPKEALSEAGESQPLGSRVPLMSEEFEASEASGTRTISSHSLALLDSTILLSPDHPLTHASPTRVSFHRRTAHIAMHTQPTLSPGMSARIAEAADLSPSSFCKRYRSSYETSSSSSSSLTLPIRNRYRGTSEHILDSKTEDESLDSDTEREGHGLDDEGHGLDDEGHGLGDEGHGLDDKGHGLEDKGIGYRALRRRGLALREGSVSSTFEVDPEDDRFYTDILTYLPVAPIQTLTSPEWSSGSLLVSPSSLVVPSPIASLVATPTATISVDKDQFLEREQKRATVMLGALWRPVLAMEAWAGHVDTRMAEMSWARYDDHRLIHDMLVQYAAMQRELQEMRGRVAALEKEMGHREQ
ncbi:hypothetical protein Tco_0496329 [Tanacetum coccineum]